MKATLVFVLFIVIQLQLPSVSRAVAATADSIVVDTFSSCTTSDIPCGWQATNKVKGLEMRQQSGNYFVGIKSESAIVSIGKTMEYAISEYPILHWRWRVHALPAGGREDDKKVSNSAAGVYVIFKGGFPVGKTLKYVWSATLSPGTMTKSPFSDKTMIIVIKSGVADTGSWRSEERNVVQDYRKAFGSEPPPPVRGIAIITSSDRSKSTAAADYDDIYISKKSGSVADLSK